jgi:hypothetical protein
MDFNAGATNFKAGRQTRKKTIAKRIYIKNSKNGSKTRIKTDQKNEKISAEENGMRKVW